MERLGLDARMAAAVAAEGRHYSTTRGRAVKVGGMATDSVGAAARQGEANNNLTRPAFRSAQGIQMPTQPQGGPLGHPLLDFSGVAGWRMVFVGLAVAYIVGFHVTLGRSRIGIGPAR